MLNEARNDARWNERSWAIWEIAERERALIAAQQGRRFPAIPGDRVNELFDLVQERACAPALPDGGFPAGAYKLDELDHVGGFLSEALFNALREHKRRRFDRTVADGGAVLAHLPSGDFDLADVVHNRQALDAIAEQAGGLTDEVKAYMWADSAGVKRSEILADSGWSVSKLKAVRRQLDDFRTRARVSIAAALPLPIVARLLRVQDAAGHTGVAGTTGGIAAGAKALLACGAAATVCGVGAVLLVDRSEAPRQPPSGTVEAQAVTRPATPAAASAAPRAATAAPARPTATATARKRRVRPAETRGQVSAAAPLVATPAPRSASPAPPADPTAFREATSDDFNQEFTP